MPETNITEITVEKTPAYFVSKTVPGRVHRLNSTIKLIVVVRNPITRAISDYTQAISKKRRSISLPSFEEMALGYGSSNATGMKNGVNASWGAIRIGIYHRHIRKWLEHFPLHQIHFVDGERLITNPAAEIRAVERFLTVKPVVRQSNFATDPLKGFPCVLRKDSTLHCLGKTKGRAHPHVRLEVIRKLENFYAPQNEQFFKLINRRPYFHRNSRMPSSDLLYGVDERGGRAFFGFGQAAEISIKLDDADNRKVAKIRGEEGGQETHFLFYDGETISGIVGVAVKKKFDHQGIRIEFIGQIELNYDRGNQHDFITLMKELARPGELTQNAVFRFEFPKVEKPYESYVGANVKLRYFLRVVIVRRLTDIIREMDVIVHTLSSYPDTNNSIKMEVGIEDSLHIEFEYNRSKYHLKDVIVGKIYFLLVRIKIKFMEIAIIKRETVGNSPNVFNENETIAKYEIMDGAPVRGESIPIRLFLAGYDLTPTMRDVGKKFSVRYYLNLVLVDEEDRRYFKQQEMTLWRKADKISRHISVENVSTKTNGEAAATTAVEHTKKVEAGK
uniref:Vacuolar protein sorting-associated protein 26 n=1 Tax=Setaria digitata TaxID=48799 RepID=A0A915PPJ4_9BILA